MDPAIAGFNVYFNFAPAFEMKAEDAYLCAIDFIYAFASNGWESLVPNDYQGSSPEVNGVKIFLGNLAPPAGPYQMQHKHIIVGLALTMNNLARRKRFCFTKASLWMYREQIGQMAIGRRHDPDPGGSNGTNVIMLEIDPPRNVTARPRLTIAGIIVDPEDSDFVISYEMLEEAIPCQELLNAAVNAIAKSAKQDNDDPCTDFAGFSSSSKVMYMVKRNTSGTSRLVLNYHLVRTVFRLLPAKLYEEETCGGVGFDLIYDHEELGGGSFVLSDFQNKDRTTLK